MLTKPVSRAAGEGKQLYIGHNSQEMPKGDGCKEFLKNNLNKADLIRRLIEFVKRELPGLHLHYPPMITLENEAWEMLLPGV